MDTLYEYVESYTYSAINPDHWYRRRIIRNNQIYHKCVEVCSQKYPFVGSNRVCVSSCTGEEMVVGNRKFCRDKNVNNGFCVINACQVHGFKCYYMECFKGCPVFTVSYNNSCVIECFNDKPYIFNGECVSQCPKEYVLDKGVCQLTCSYGRFLFNKTCVDKCPRRMEFVDDHQCVSECPTQKVIQDKRCVDNCSEQFVLDGRSCNTKCSSGLFEHNKTCVDTCPNGTFKEYQKCVNNCSSGFYRYESHCVKTCPSDNFINKSNNLCVNKCEGFKYYQQKNIFCLNTCPEKMVEINSTCVSHCPKSRPFLHKVSCLAECPVSSKYFEQKNEPDNIITYTCVEECKKYTLSISNMCIDACSLKKVLFQETCQEECPDSDPVKVHLPATHVNELNLTTFVNFTEPINAFVICAKECPSDFVRDNGECYVECPMAEKSKTLNLSCIRNCPEEYPIIIKENNRSICTDRCDKLRYQQFCIDQCPESHNAIYRGECVQCSQIGMYEENQQCVNRCGVVHFENRCYNNCPQTDKFMYNGTCLRSCPSNASKVDEQHHEPNNFFVCMENCPSEKFTFGNNCVSNCPDSKRLPVDGECMACHEVGKYDDGSKCVDICQDLHHEYRCVDNCPKQFKIFNKTCVRNCPKIAPLSILIHDYNTNIIEYRCVKSCHEDKPYLNKNNCVKWCDYQDFISNKTCVKKCPVDAPYISNNYVKDTYNKECLKHCKDSDYSLNYSCMGKCPKGLFSHTRQCLHECPIDFPYISQDDTCVMSCPTLRRGTSCFDKCPSKTFQYNRTCVQKCPFSKPYNNKGKCVKVCPNFLIKKTCFEQCPYGLVGYHKKCLLQCPPESKYRYKWECILECPKNTFHGLIKYTCFDTCPHGQFKYLQKCVGICPKEAPYDFKGECVRSCSGYLDGLKCYKQCPKMFSFVGKCILKCPKEAPFVNNKECVHACPYVHDNHLNCMKECPEHTYQQGKQCKAGCPPERPFLGTLLNANCLVRCGNHKLASENNKCISRSSCTTFIYGMWCLQNCPPHTYLLHSKDEKICKSLITVYVMVGILFFIVVITIAFVIRVFYHCCKIQGVSFFS